MPSPAPRWPEPHPSDSARPVVVFDVDGTLLDSAPGIVAGLRHALVTVGLTPPSDDRLRSDLGPPLRHLLQRFGVGEARLELAVTAYRDFYFGVGLDLALPYPGVPEMVLALRRAGYRLGTATAKRTDVATAILARHHLLDHFTVVNGAEDADGDKAVTLRRTLLDLRSPGAAVMVGDRHYDVTAARLCGCRAVGVGWGYGSVAELLDAGAESVVSAPGDLVELLVPTA